MKLPNVLMLVELQDASAQNNVTDGLRVLSVTGLSLPPDYLGSRTLADLHPPGSTLGSTEFHFSIDGQLTMFISLSYHGAYFIYIQLLVANLKLFH